jgi:plasmid stability protein
MLAMATLHVRNVPEPLYEALRRAAAENDRSIGAMAVALLNESLSTGRRGFPFFGRSARAAGAPLQAFADVARSAIADAQAIARQLGHESVGTEDVLIALLAHPKAGVAPALAGLGVTLAAVRERVAAGPGTPSGTIPFAPETKQALELALRESLRMRCPLIDASHLVVGLAAACGGAAAILAELGCTADALRLPLLAQPGASRIKPFRVIQLEGEAEEWEEQLQDAADGPYELLQIVGTRAVFGFRRP